MFPQTPYSPITENAAMSALIGNSGGSEFSDRGVKLIGTLFFVHTRDKDQFTGNGISRLKLALEDQRSQLPATRAEG